MNPTIKAALDNGEWPHNVVHWPRLILGEHHGDPAPLTPPKVATLLIQDTPAPVFGDSTEPYNHIITRQDTYSRRVLADDGATTLVGFVAEHVTTDEARLNLLLTHPDGAIE